MKNQMTKGLFPTNSLLPKDVTDEQLIGLIGCARPRQEESCRDDERLNYILSKV